MFKMETCDKECEVFSRIVGYFRPVQRWNAGKAEEFKLRKTYTKLDGEFEKLNKGPRQETLKDNDLEKSR